MILTPVFGPNPGALRMWSYAPEGLPRGAPLVVTLHGCGQAAESFAGGLGWLALADRLGFAVLAPEQTRANNPARCFNWFEPADVTRGAGEAASIRAQIERMVAVHRLDRNRVFAAGAVIAAAPFGAASGVGEAMLAMARPAAATGRALGARVRAASRHTGAWPRLAVWQGDADRTVAPANAEAIVAQWLDVHGLPPAPTRTETVGALTRRIWEDLPGEAVVEFDLVAGLGHGAALATTGPAGLGRTAPFLLEAGISSTLTIADFFHLGRPAAAEAIVQAAAPAARGFRRLWSRIQARLR
jgi:feruloyl esterase